MKLREHFQKFMGMPEVLVVLTTMLDSMKESIIEACQDVLTTREPYLACVTFMADTPDYEHGLGPLAVNPTAFGAEVFISPGEQKHVRVPVQIPVDHISFFVSGHPNIVITSVVVGNEHQTANNEGMKFGRLRKAVRPGEFIEVNIAFRTAAQ